MNELEEKNFINREWLLRPGILVAVAVTFLFGPGIVFALDGDSSLALGDVVLAFVLLGGLILTGRELRRRIPQLRSLFLPSAIVAGGIALLLGPGVLGAIATPLFGENSPLAEGLFPPSSRAVWSTLPALFINLVFAAIFLGEFIPSPRKIWQLASPQVAFGQALAWGQYVVGLLLTLTILTPRLGLNPIAGALIEIAFEGGHGTAAGMAKTLESLGFAAGVDLALGLATVGIVAGLVAGILLANWGQQKGYIPVMEAEEQGSRGAEGQKSIQNPKSKIQNSPAPCPKLANLFIHFGFIGGAIALGWVMWWALAWIESATWNRGGDGLEILAAIPLFPFALIGGILIQLLLERLGATSLIDRSWIERIGGFALDVTIVAALASLSLEVLGSYLGAFFLLAACGIAWNILFFIYLAPRMIPTYWFERGMGDMGQSMGITATGILLMQMVDPDNRSGAFGSFAYKQLFFEPIVGGGLFTAAAPPLIAQFGPVPVLLLTLGLLVFWLIFGLWNCQQIRQNIAAEANQSCQIPS
jgi:ESS family glutamate:Na+ symporter